MTVTPWSKIHVKVNKGKNKTLAMGHVFQDECWVKYPSVGVHLVY